jgi:hypothetical protein
VNRITLTAVVVSAILIPISPIDAQVPEKAILAEFGRIEDSVVRIKTISDLEYREFDPRSENGMAMRPYSVDGTGVVVGQMWVDGRLEYLILTNHHVADASNYVLEEDGYLWVNPANTLAIPSVREESYIMRSSGESSFHDAIEVIELVRLVRGDLTLMRTVNANRDLTVFDGRIGYRPGEIGGGDQIVTSGYPYGGDKVIATGTIVATNFPHDLGLSHDDLVISMPVQPGQSGGPVFLVEGGDGKPISFRLIGLVHAKDAERSFAVPYELWGDALAQFPEELQTRLVK